MITFRIRGRVVADESGAGLAGLFVKAHDKAGRFDDLLGGAVTEDSGRFEIVTEPESFRDLFAKRPLLYFTVYASDEETELYSTRRGVKWTPGHLAEVEIRLPAKVSFPEKGVRISLEGEQGVAQKEFEVGDSLALSASGLRPATGFEAVVTSDGKDLFASRLLSDARGAIETTVIWSQAGLEDPRSDERPTLDEAADRWADRALGVELRQGKKRVAGAEFALRPPSERPVLLSTDEEGRILNGFEAGDQPALLLVRNLAFKGNVRVYMVANQAEWRIGDGFTPATFADGSPAVREFEITGDERRPLEFAPADLLPTGAFDFVLRRLRYGFEEDEQLSILERDVVSGRRITGLVVREHFWEAKPVLGGCVNKLPIAGRSVNGAPYLQYADTFEVGENVYGALDPGIVDPANVSKQCAFYVIPSKDAAGWGADTSLNHLAVLGGNANTPRASVQAFCINASKRLLWGSAQDVGEYDVVADFGNNTPDMSAFTPDHSYDTPLDIIDGYFVAGFRIVHDPGTFSDPGLFAGTWNYVEGDVTAMGLQDTVTFDDETTFWETVPPGTMSRQVQLKAHVCFPADSAGVTDPAQISATQAAYPLVAIVHGNGHDYTAYDFLLQHLARNGFIAASIDNRFLSGGVPVHGMHGLGRANCFFKHLEVLKAKFGTKMQDNIGVMGHSRGGEAVTKIARLNQQLGLGNDIRAALALGPTDHYGREVLASPHDTPFLVVYGSRDGDVSGGDPSASVPRRRTGFTLYDRARDADKSMAFVYRATHNGFITVNENSDNPLPVATQRSIIQAYSTGFFRRHLRSEPQWDGMLQGEWKPASVVATGAEVYLQHRRPGGRVVDDFEGAAPDWQSSTITGAVDHGGSLPADPAEGRLVDAPGAPGLDFRSPHDSNGLRLRWDNLGDRLTWTVPAGQGDVTGFSLLSLRITQTEASPSNPVNQPQDLRIGLRDSANNERAVRVGAFTLIPYPDQRAQANLRKSALMTVRIPLSSYTIVCAGQPQVDLTNLTHLFLDFSMTPAGEIEVDEIEFTA